MNTKCWIFSRPDKPPATVEDVDDPLEEVLDDVAWGTEVVGETLDDEEDGAVVTVAPDAHATTRKTSPTTIAAQVRERAATRPADLRPLAGAMGYPPMPLRSLFLISSPPSTTDCDRRTRNLFPGPRQRKPDDAVIVVPASAPRTRAWPGLELGARRVHAGIPRAKGEYLASGTPTRRLGTER